MTSRHALLVALALAYTERAVAQTSRADPSDVQAWGSATLKLDFPRKWEGSLSLRGRAVDDASSYRGTYLSASLSRPAAKWLDLGVGYRFATVTGSTANRVSAFGEVARTLSGTRVALRTMLQYQKKDFADDDEPSESDSYLRVRAEAKRELANDLDAYVSIEPYVTLGASGYPIDNWRNTIGVKYDYAKGKRLDVFYIYRPDYAKSYNRTFHVIGVDLSFDWKVP